MPHRKTVSIEIGSEQIRAVELMDGRKNANVFNVLEFQTPAGCVRNGYITNPEKLADLLRSRLEERGILNNNVVFSVISEDILVGGAEIERGRKKDIEEEVRNRAQELFGLAGPRQKPEDAETEDSSAEKTDEVRAPKENDKPNIDNHDEISIDDYYTAYVEQDGSGSDWSMNVIVYAAPKDLIDSYYELAEHADLNLEATDYSGNSLFQWTRKTFGNDAVMLVDLRSRGSTATILTEGVLRVQVDLMSRTTGLIEAMKARDEAEEMEGFLEDTASYTYGEDRIRREAEPLVEELNSLAAEFLNENPEEYIDQIVLSAGGEGGMITASQIQKRTGIETITIEDLPRKTFVKDDSVFEYLDPSNFVGVIGAVIAPLSFHMPESESGHSRTRSTTDRVEFLTRIFLIVMVVGLILTAALCVTYFILRSHNKALDSSLDQVKYIEDIYEEYQEAEENNREIRALDKTTEQKNELISRLFADLEEKMPSDSKLTSMNASDDMVSFSVSAKDKASAAQFIVQLRKIDYLTDISVSDLTDTKDSAGNTSVDFTISAYLSGEVVEDYDSSDGANDDGISSGNYNGKQRSDNDDNDDDDYDDDDDDDDDAIGQTASFRSESA